MISINNIESGRILLNASSVFALECALGSLDSDMDDVGPGNKPVEPFLEVLSVHRIVCSRPARADLRNIK